MTLDTSTDIDDGANVGDYVNIDRIFHEMHYKKKNYFTQNGAKQKLNLWLKTNNNNNNNNNKNTNQQTGVFKLSLANPHRILTKKVFSPNHTFPFVKRKKKNPKCIYSNKSNSKYFIITHDDDLLLRLFLFSAICASDWRLHRTMVSTNTHVSSLVFPGGISTT